MSLRPLSERLTMIVDARLGFSRIGTANQSVIEFDGVASQAQRQVEKARLDLMHFLHIV
jgi:hypothetical protein